MMTEGKWSTRTTKAKKIFEKKKRKENNAQSQNTHRTHTGA